MTDTPLLEQGFQAAQAGQRKKARALLARAVQQDPRNEHAWVWLASVVEDDRQKLYCLRRAQQINPDNRTVTRAVRALEARLEPGVDEPADAPQELGDRRQPVEEPAEKASPHPRRGETVLSLSLFVGRRLAFGVLVLASIIYLSYLGLDMAGGAELGAAAGGAVLRTAKYVGRALRGDLGLTTAGSNTMLPRPVAEVIAERLPRSLGLLAISLLFASLVGVSLGLLAARGRSRHSLAILLSTLVGISVPSFFAAFLLQWAATAYTRQVGRQLLPVGGFGWDRRLILPALVLAARPIAQITRIAFVSVRQVLDQDYIRTAHSKGLRQRQIWAVHVMRNAAIPIVTTIGVSLRFSLSSLPVIELYFGWGGVGVMLLKAIAQRDDNLTVASVVCLGALFMALNLVLELGYRLIDPRLWHTPAHIALANRQGVVALVRSAVSALSDLVQNNPLSDWLGRRRVQAKPALQHAAPKRPTTEEDDELARIGRVTRAAAWRSTARNVPLTVGSLLIFGLVVVIFFGPSLSPRSPYSTQGLMLADGQFISPPFAPGTEHPWGTDMLGRDMMSLILSGAQQTLVLAVLAVAARTLVGVLLGAIAGWTTGSYLDRLVLSAAEIIASFPTLLLAMALILAFGIRQGMSSFILALCFVGWGEIMQFVRSEVAALRPRPYIESAVAVGARTPRIVVRHILPQLLSALISIVALEMGAVLMLLGELGFISIFIGGGIVNAPIPGRRVFYSDVPEWGALLSDLRYQARSYPWTGLYPMLAFFASILSFNLFGEGIRRLVEDGRIVVRRLLNGYTAGLAVVTTIAFVWLSTHSGSAAFYQEHAKEFSGERAFGHVAALADPTLEGRALGTTGMDLAADYVAAQFVTLGLQPAGQEGTFFQERTRSFERLDAIPSFNIQDGGPVPVYKEDFAAYPGPYVTDGTADAPVRAIGLGKQGAAPQGGTWRYVYPDLVNASFGGEIVLALSSREASVLSRFPKDGFLVMADDPSQLRRRFTFGGRTGHPLGAGEETPRLWISEEMADRLLVGIGYTAAELREQSAEWAIEQVVELPTTMRASIQIEGTWEEKWPVRHVLGYLPGTHSYDFCYDCLGNRLILVMAQYDCPPLGPEGTVYPAANDNASGVAVMLEAIRVMQETDYQPYKTFLFVAYSAEGLEGGEYVLEPDVTRFLQARPGLSKHQLEAIVQVQGVGGGSGRRVEVSASGSLRLAKLFGQAARRVGAGVVRADETIDIGIIYEETAPTGESAQKAPLVRLSWENWAEHSRLPTDTLEHISEDKLEKSGQTLALALMILGRETEY